MTVYNCEKYVLESIQSILSQTYNNFEFIIVDDMSDDKTKIIIDSIDDKRIRFIKSSKKLGRTKALNWFCKIVVQSLLRYKMVMMYLILAD